MVTKYRQSSFHKQFRRKEAYCQKHYWVRLVFGKCSACAAERGDNSRVIDPDDYSQEDLNKMPFNPLSTEGRNYTTVVKAEGRKPSRAVAPARGDEGVPKPSAGRTGTPKRIISDFHFRRMYPYARR